MGRGRIPNALLQLNTPVDLPDLLSPKLGLKGQFIDFREGLNIKGLERF